MSNNNGQQFNTYILSYVNQTRHTTQPTRQPQPTKTSGKPSKNRPSKRRVVAPVKTAKQKKAVPEIDTVSEPKTGTRCLIFRPGSRSPEAEGVAYLDYDANTVLIGAAALPDLASVSCNHYVGWLRKRASGAWLRIDLAMSDSVWTGYTETHRPLAHYDRLAITAEREDEPINPLMNNCVLASDISEPTPIAQQPEYSNIRTGRHCILLNRTLGAPQVAGVAYLNYITGILLLVTTSMPPPEEWRPETVAWMLWLHQDGTDSYHAIPLRSNDNGMCFIREQVQEMLANTADIFISAEETKDAMAPYGRRILVANLDNSHGPL